MPEVVKVPKSDASRGELGLTFEANWGFGHQESGSLGTEILGYWELLGLELRLWKVQDDETD